MAVYIEEFKVQRSEDHGKEMITSISLDLTRTILATKDYLDNCEAILEVFAQYLEWNASSNSFGEERYFTGYKKFDLKSSQTSNLLELSSFELSGDRSEHSMITKINRYTLKTTCYGDRSAIEVTGNGPF